MVKKLDFKLTGSTGSGVFHDSRSDCRNLAKVCNLLIDKVNELVAVVS